MVQNRTQLFTSAPAIKQNIEWGFFERRGTDGDQHPRESGDFRIVTLKIESDRHVITRIRVPFWEANTLWHESNEKVVDVESGESYHVTRPRTATNDGYTQLRNAACINPISFIVLGSTKPKELIAHVKVLGFPDSEFQTKIHLNEISLKKAAPPA
jgi:hypothetical protein